MGVHGDLLRWFSSYISNRSQAVVINNYISGWIPIPSGVPQGSLLGPLLFNIFVDDISNCCLFSNLLCFADDMKIYAKIKSEADALLVQSDLVRLDDYCRVNKLDLNPSKCFAVTFSRQRQIIPTVYTLKGTVLQKLPFMRDLGVVHDSKLLFDVHIDGIIGGALKMLGFVMRSSLNFCKAKTLKILYCSFVRSKLEYASQVWNPRYRTYIDRIERVQKKFMKFLCFKLKVPYISSDYYTLCKKHHLIPLHKRREIADIIYALSITSGKVECPELLSSISFNTPNRSKRYHPPISLKFGATKYRKNSFMRRAFRSLNDVAEELDIDIFNCNLSTVRRRLAERWFE